MTSVQLNSGLSEREQRLARGMIAATLRAADPERAMRAHMAHLPKDTPTHILAFGKASLGMSAGAIESLGSRFARATILAPESLALKTQFKNKLIATFPCDHPLPTQRNIDATRVLVDHAHSIPDDHRVLVLISGGASAMLCLPHPRVTLDEIREGTLELLASGAGIHELNASRSQLESLKAGGLAHELRHVSDRYCFLLSDVIGDDPSVIGSGPMHDANPPRTPHMVIASNNIAIDALAAWCANEHIDCREIIRHATGEAHNAGTSIADRLLKAGPGDSPIAIILGGETVVDTDGQDGIGGPALELGLSAAVHLAPAAFDWSVVTFTTDGVDGPGKAAGCALTSSMISAPIKREAALGALKAHDTRSICDTLGATIDTGPTGTNVNDVAIVIRWPDTSTDTNKA